MTNKVVDKVNSQINAEFYSAYMYLSMAAYFENKNLAGFAKWMRTHAQEEQAHAMKFFSHLLERGQHVELEAIEKPKTNWNSPIEVFEEALEHECTVTKMINELSALAEEEKDRPLMNLCVLFIDEQVEEENVFGTILAELKMIDGNGHGLLMLDRELASRTSEAI